MWKKRDVASGGGGKGLERCRVKNTEAKGWITGPWNRKVERSEMQERGKGMYEWQETMKSYKRGR